MAVTQKAYEKKTLWLKPIKNELIAFVLWPEMFPVYRKKAVTKARRLKRWGWVEQFTDAEFKTLKKHRKALNENETLAKLKKASGI